MQAPVGDVGFELGGGQGEAADEEDEGYGAVDDGVFGADDAAVGSDVLSMLVLLN